MKVNKTYEVKVSREIIKALKACINGLWTIRENTWKKLKKNI